MKILRKLLWLLLYLLPAVLFFSYHPVIALGQNPSMNFELSLPLLWLIVFDVLSFIVAIVFYVKGRRGPKPSSTRPASSSSDDASVSRRDSKTSPTRSVSSSLDAGHRSSKATSAHPFWGRDFPGPSDRRFFLFSLFPLYLTISVFWSANPLRGLLTAGVMWAVFFAVFSILYILPQTSFPRHFRNRILIIMFVSAVLICKYCYAQSIMDVCGLSRDATLLCPGCTYHSFGFPHPSGFAIEPQFMGNLLLAPTLTALYLVVFRSRQSAKDLVGEVAQLKNTAEHTILNDKIKLPEVNWKRWQRIGMTILAGFLSMTLFFTFSRGAIYAYVVAIFVLFIFALKRHQFRWSLITIPLVSFILSLSLQGIFAAVGPTAENFISGVTKSLHHLSLGIVDLRPQSASQVTEEIKQIPETVEKLADFVDQELVDYEEKLNESSEQRAEDVIFEGYVPESTNIRLKLNQVAIWTWLSAPYRQGTFWIGLDCIHSDHPECSRSVRLTPTSVLFGVGLGGAGTAMNAAYPDRVTSAKEIVQHEGFSLLLESGLVGIGLAIFSLLLAFAPHLFSRRFLDGKAAAQANNVARISAQATNATIKPVQTAKSAQNPAKALQNASQGSKFALEGPSQSKPSSHTTSTPQAPQSAKNKPLTLKSTSATPQISVPAPLSRKASPSPFWSHPALPLLLSLVIAYLVTLNFFSGLPNALQIYLMPPLLYLIFAEPYQPHLD